MRRGSPHSFSLRFGSDRDYRPTAVVDPLAEQVLPEPSLLPAQEVRQRLELVVVAARYRPPSASVVDQRVDRLLEHALLVADDDLRRLEVDEPLQPVVPVDHAAVQVVQVARRESTAVELHHRAQFRGQHRQDRENHPLGLVAALAERLHDAESLDGLLAPLAGCCANGLLQVYPLGVEVHALQDLQNGLRAHAVGEYLGIPRAQLAVLRLSQELAHLEPFDFVDLRLVFRLKLRQLFLELGVHPDDLRLRLLGLLAQSLLFFRGIGIFRYERRQLLHLRLRGRFKFLRLLLELESQALDGRLSEVLMYAGHQVLSEVDDAFQVSRGQIEHQAQPARNALGEPDVGDRGRQGDPAHALPAHLRTGNLHAATVADYPLVANLLVLPAVALPVLRRTENPLAEQTVLLRPEGPVVDGLRLGDFAVRPDLDLLRRCQRNADCVEVIAGLNHVRAPVEIVALPRRGTGKGGEYLGYLGRYAAFNRRRRWPPWALPRPLLHPPWRAAPPSPSRVPRRSSVSPTASAPGRRIRGSPRSRSGTPPRP